MLRANKEPVVPTFFFPPDIGAIGPLPRISGHVEQILSDREMLVRCFFTVRVTSVANFERRGETIERPVVFLIRGPSTRAAHRGGGIRASAGIRNHGAAALSDRRRPNERGLSDLGIRHESSRTVFPRGDRVQTLAPPGARRLQMPGPPPGAVLYNLCLVGHVLPRPKSPSVNRLIARRLPICIAKLAETPWNRHWIFVCVDLAYKWVHAFALNLAELGAGFAVACRGGGGCNSPRNRARSGGIKKYPDRGAPLGGVTVMIATAWSVGIAF